MSAHGGARKGAGRKAGQKDARPRKSKGAGVPVSLRVTSRAREILARDARPGELVSLLVERYADSRESRPLTAEE